VSKSMDMEQFRELVARCLEGAISDEEQERVVEAAESSPELSDYLERMVHIHAALKARRYDEAAFAQAVLDKLSNRHGTGRFRNAVLEELRAKGMLESRARPGRRFFTISAIAASIAILVGAAVSVHLARRPGGRGVPGGALGELVSGAERARTVADLKALSAVARRAYEEELARGAACDPVMLIDLGLSTAVTGNPREDRQADDLRFLAENAARAWKDRLARARAWSVPGVMSVAEAAATGPTPEEVREIREKYAKARTHADRKFYQGWGMAFADLNDKTVNPRGWRHISDALWFEHVYVFFYEQGLDCTLKDTADVSWPKGLAHRDYFDANLRPIFDEAARLRRSLESNIDFKKQERSGDGMWAVHQLYRGRDSVVDLDFWAVLQAIPDSRDSWLHLGEPNFEEAVLTGRFHVAAVSPGHERNMKTGWMVFFENGQRSVRLIKGREESLRFTKDTWFWFLSRFRKTGSGEWELTNWVWQEGGQPLNIRSLLPGDPVLAGNESSSFTAKDRSYRGPGGIAFRASRVKIEWQALGLRILRPAPGGEEAP